MRLLLKRPAAFLSPPYQPPGFAPSQHRRQHDRALAQVAFPTRKRGTWPPLPSTQTGGTKPPERHRLEVGEEADSTSNTTASIIARLGGLVRKAGLFLQPAGLPRGFSLRARGKAVACSVSDCSALTGRRKVGSPKS